jgi:hypothetical protein
MRKIMSIAALVALIATPAFAKTHTVNRNEMREAPVSLGAPQAYPGDRAFRGAQVMGQDPDSHVRFELGRDNPTY